MAQIAKALRKEMGDLIYKGERLRPGSVIPYDGSYDESIRLTRYGNAFPDKKIQDIIDPKDYEEQFRNPQIEEP